MDIKKILNTAKNTYFFKVDFKYKNIRICRSFKDRDDALCFYNSFLEVINTTPSLRNKQFLFELFDIFYHHKKPKSFIKLFFIVDNLLNNDFTIRDLISDKVFNIFKDLRLSNSTKKQYINTYIKILLFGVKIEWIEENKLILFKDRLKPLYLDYKKINQRVIIVHRTVQVVPSNC